MPSDNQIASHLLRSRISSVCVAITGASPGEICSRAAEVLAETSFLEFRLDYLPDPTSAIPAFQKFLHDHAAATVIATCRPTSFGGRFSGKAEQAFEILLKAAAAGFQLVDLDLKAAESLGAQALDRLRGAGAGVILSEHDFKGMSDLQALYARMEPFAPDFLKLAVTARTLTDNLTLLRFLQKTEVRAGSSLIGICMGERGILSRVLGPRSGSAFTFGSAGTGEETAPGQLTARALLETYRVAQLDKATKVFGVAGDPIGSSLSPLMLNTAFRRETVNAVYVALATRDPKELLQLAREIPIGGLSITMPLKRDIMPLLERTDPLSTKIGAVNTVLRAQDGKFYGFNTDVAGIVGPLERRTSLREAKVLVLGAGGAARAAVFGCRDKGAQVSILNRTPANATALAKAAGAKVIGRAAVAKAGFDIVINATPAGMNGQTAELLLQPEDLNARFVFDLVYNPLETPLLRLARQKGLIPISGVEMFVTQGARQFEIWTGKPAPLDEMTRVVLHALRQKDSVASTSEPQAAAAKALPSSVTTGRPVPAASPAHAARNGSSSRSAAKSPKTHTAEPHPAKPQAAKAQSAKAQSARVHTPAAAKASPKATVASSRTKSRPAASKKAVPKAAPKAKRPAAKPAPAKKTAARGSR